MYVGQGDRIANRLRDHREKFWFRQPIIQSGAFIGINEKALRQKMEKVLIKFLKSGAVLNKQDVDR